MARRRLAAAGPAPPGEPGSPVRPRPCDLTPDHRDLMTEHHDLRAFGRLAAAEQHQPAKDANRDQVEQAKGHKPRSCRNRLIRPKRRSRHLQRILKRYTVQDTPETLGGSTLITRLFIKGPRSQTDR